MCIYIDREERGRKEKKDGETRKTGLKIKGFQCFFGSLVFVKYFLRIFLIWNYGRTGVPGCESERERERERERGGGVSEKSEGREEREGGREGRKMDGFFCLSGEFEGFIIHLLYLF
jgi:hypothetical protein